MKDKYYRTKHFYWACFLYAKDLEIVGINKENGNRDAEFVFLKNTEIEIWQEIFNFGKEGSFEMLVDSRKFIKAIKELKEKLYSD